MSRKIHRCIYCNKQYVEYEGLMAHINKVHKNELPKNISAEQHMFNIRNNKTHGTCIICSNETKWNSNTNKYERLCSLQCKEIYREQFKKRMMDKYGKEHLLNDAEQQKKMLANRKISGVYKWSDGGEVSYTGSYELDFLRFLDVVMKFGSNDVITPAPQTFYYHDGNNVKRFYIPDVYIPSLNLLVEIKDGGSNPNNHHKIQRVDKDKEHRKDELMKKQNKYNFLKLTDKDYSLFFDFLALAKKNNKESLKDPIVKLGESSTLDLLNKYEEKLYKNISIKAINEQYENIDIDKMLCEGNIKDQSSFTIYENLEYRHYGIPSEKKFPINNEDNMKRTLLSFRYCEKNKRKELARNILLQNKNLNVPIAENHLLWSYVDDVNLLAEKVKENSYYEADRKIKYTNIPCNVEISNLIETSDNIYLGSDYHLWCNKRKTLTLKKKKNNINDVILTRHNSIVKENDLFICLGDLVNDDFEDKKALADYIQKLNGKKVLVIGNNDVFDKQFYIDECKFDYVVESFRHENLVFTHHPIQTESDDINIHGHIHFSKQYHDIQYNNHIDVCIDAHNFYPISLERCLHLQKLGYYHGETIKGGNFVLFNNLHENVFMNINNFTTVNRNNSDMIIIGHPDKENIEEVKVKIIGICENHDSMKYIGKYVNNKHYYTEFEMVNLLHKEDYTNIYLVNENNNLISTVDYELDTINLENEKLLENFTLDSDGSILIRLREKSNFMSKYNTSHKLLKIYKQSNNIEGVKHQLCKLWYMYIIIEEYYVHAKNINPITKAMINKNKDEALKAKSFIMNDFTTYLKWLLDIERDFNFDLYFKDTEYNRDLLTINTKGYVNLLKNLIR